MGLGRLSEPKSKLGLPRVTMELDKSVNQSFQGGLEKIIYMSSNGPPGNCCKIQNQYLIGHVLGGHAKWRVYSLISNFFKNENGIVSKGSIGSST